MEVLSLLADPTRRRIVEMLADGEMSAGEIAEHFDIARPGVSRHLRQLREGGLVSVERHGQQQIYSLVAEPLDDLDRWLAPLRSFWANRLDALGTELSRGHNEPAPRETRTRSA